MTTEEMIIVMQEWLDGKEIEVRLIGTKKWLECQDPEWDWSKMDYRVKPEPPKPKYVPYESAEEFLKAQKEHGPYVDLLAYREESWNCYSMPYEVYNASVVFLDDSAHYLSMATFSYENFAKNVSGRTARLAES